MKIRRRLVLGMLAVLSFSCAEGQRPAASTAPAEPAQQTSQTPAPRRIPSRLSVYDYATEGELLLGYLLAPSARGDAPSSWPLLATLKGGLGKLERFVDAGKITEAINEAMSTEGQPLHRLDSVVDHCVATLHIKRPDVRVRNSPETKAAFVRVGEHEFLIVNSGLLNLFEGRKEELEFVIGRELARSQSTTSNVIRAVAPTVSALRRIPFREIEAWIPPTTLFGWTIDLSQVEHLLKRAVAFCRESEFSLDRAGLICCQEPRVAYNAMARLMCGLKPDSAWIDPDARDFSSAAILAKFDACRSLPELLRYVADSGADAAPYTPERLANLKEWVKQGKLQALLDRVDEPRSASLVFDAVKLFGVAPGRTDCDPYIIAKEGDKEIFRTAAVPGKDFAAAGSKATWDGLNAKLPTEAGKPIFFEIWDRNYITDTLLGGFAIFPCDPATDPERGKSVYSEAVKWNWQGASSNVTAASAEVLVRFSK